MADILVVYDTKYGHSRKIAEHAAALARTRGHVAHVVHVGEIDALGHADAVVVLSPVFAGKHTDRIRAFVAKHVRTLQARPSAFFSVSGSAGSSDPAERAQADQLARRFIASTGWRPTVVASFGGAIAYPLYNPVLRFLLRFMAKRNGGPTDTSRIHELTDWGAVESAMIEVLADVERKKAPMASIQQTVG